MIFNLFAVPFYNQPKICPYATWDPDAITFANSTLVGNQSYGLVVDLFNTVYAADSTLARIQIWLEGNSMPLGSIYVGLGAPYGVFVTINGDVYIDNAKSAGRLEVWTPTAVQGASVINMRETCYGLSVDVNGDIYCSINTLHQVIKRSFNFADRSSVVSIVAGNGMSASTSYTLSGPQGIFVDENLNLYVADTANNRIQLFLAGERNATTVAGVGAPGTITLNHPMGVVLDADGYLFIVDTFNHRIVASGPNGFRCVVGCSSPFGSASYQLRFPWSLSFDSYGNLFVADSGNSRIQKFILVTNSCGKLVSCFFSRSEHLFPPLQLAKSFNRPKLCPLATWNPDARTIASDVTSESLYFSVFVNTNNTLYASGINQSQIQVWSEGSIYPSRRIWTDTLSSRGIFVTTDEDIYADRGRSDRLVVKWTKNGSGSLIPVNVGAHCTGLFVDLYNYLYCSNTLGHQVLKRSLNIHVLISIPVAGTSTRGSRSDMLYYPHGIFVDNNLQLFVADCGNDRVQLFEAGQVNATTVAGNGSASAFPMDCPTGVVFDADGHLFILERDNHRIVRSGPNGFQCIVGCTNSNGSAAYQLSNPYALSFDSHGNLFVADFLNNRIQKFLIMPTSCGESQISNLLPLPHFSINDGSHRFLSR